MRNPLKHKLAQGEAVFGIWSLIPSAPLSEVMASAGLDFQILDMEHGVYDLASLDAGVRACEAAGCSPMVRVPGANPFAVQSALDLGAHGVVVPQIADCAAAKIALEQQKFAPRGTRGFNPFTRGGGFDPAKNASRLDNDFALTCLIIESPRAYDELDEILALPDLDMIYLGVYDFSVALGCPGQMDDPRLEEFVVAATRKARDKGKAVGALVKSKTEMERFLNLGANVLVYAVDTFVIHRAISGAVREFGEARTDSKD